MLKQEMANTGPRERNFRELGCRLAASASDSSVTSVLVMETLSPAIFASGMTPSRMLGKDTMAFHANFHFQNVSGGKEVVLRDTAISGVKMWCLAPRSRGICSDRPYYCP